MRASALLPPFDLQPPAGGEILRGAGQFLINSSVSSVPSSSIAEQRKTLTAPLPPKLRNELETLGRHFRTRGLRVFVFGSVARTWPNAAPTSDLDLGFQWIVPGHHPETTERELARRVADLPTVRPVDLVNFSTTSRSFATCAHESTIDLGDE